MHGGRKERVGDCRDERKIHARMPRHLSFSSAVIVGGSTDEAKRPDGQSDAETAPSKKHRAIPKKGDRKRGAHDGSARGSPIRVVPGEEMERSRNWLPKTAAETLVTVPVCLSLKKMSRGKEKPASGAVRPPENRVSSGPKDPLPWRARGASTLSLSWSVAARSLPHRGPSRSFVALPRPS